MRCARLMVCLLMACGDGSDASTPATTTEPSRERPGGMPLLSSAETSIVRGEVVDLAPAGPYTYVHIDGPDTATWVVVLGTPAFRIGDVAAFRVYGLRRGFHSSRLARDFDLLLFGRTIREENS